MQADDVLATWVIAWMVTWEEDKLLWSLASWAVRVAWEKARTSLVRGEGNHHACVRHAKGTSRGCRSLGKDTGRRVHLVLLWLGHWALNLG